MANGPFPGRRDTRLVPRKTVLPARQGVARGMFWHWGLPALMLLFCMAAVLAAYGLVTSGASPRQVGPYILKRSAGHNRVIIAVGNWVGNTLIASDRATPVHLLTHAVRLGAQPEPVPVAEGAARQVLVQSGTAALEAIRHARPGDVITFLPGRYRFDGQRIDVAVPGTAGAPITVRAQQPGSVILEMAMVEGFVVSAPYWHFANLTLTGTCARHTDCEHAFHIVGRGTHFVARNNTLVDFNAHFKINGLDGAFPDDGLIDGNTLTNGSVRETANPVTPIDLVAASNWVIRKNRITDFLKGEGNQVSYGAFVKGGGGNNVLENNLVVCEDRLHAPRSRQVGLSLGGGGTGQEVCRDRRCITEQDGSMIRANLIAACSDDGIYLNRAATSKVLHNTVIDTGGITVRFPESTADVSGNLVDGPIRARNEAILRQSDNIDTPATRLLLGSHPLRDVFGQQRQSSSGARIPRQEAGSDTDFPDLCTGRVTAARAYGAFADFQACLR